MWASLEDLSEKIRYYLEHPHEALRIARAGREAFWSSHSPARKRRQFLDLIFKGWIDPTYDVYRDPRCRLNRRHDIKQFMTRLAVVEYVQTLHMNRDRVQVAMLPGVDPTFACDLADLPRVHQSWLGPMPKLFTQAGVRDQVRQAAPEELDSNTRWAAVLLSAKEAAEPLVLERLGKARPEAIVFPDILTDEGRPHAPAAVAALSKLRYEPFEDGLMTIFLRPGFEPELPANHPRRIHEEQQPVRCALR
jgi:hypothetical protein